MDNRGFKYSKEREKGPKTFWACVHKMPGCNARLTTGSDGTIVNCSGEHNHLPTENIQI